MIFLYKTAMPHHKGAQTPKESYTAQNLLNKAKIVLS